MRRLNAISRSVSIPSEYITLIMQLVEQGRYEGLSHFTRIAIREKLIEEGLLTEEHDEDRHEGC